MLCAFFAIEANLFKVDSPWKDGLDCGKGAKHGVVIASRLVTWISRHNQTSERQASSHAPRSAYEVDESTGLQRLMVEMPAIATMIRKGRLSRVAQQDTAWTCGVLHRLL
jgi:hypothetical protein